MKSDVYIHILEVLNAYSALITAVLTGALAYLTYALVRLTNRNIEEERHSRKLQDNYQHSENEKEPVVKVLQDILLLIEYIFIYKMKARVKHSEEDMDIAHNKCIELRAIIKQYFMFLPKEVQYLVQVFDKYVFEFYSKDNIHSEDVNIFTWPEEWLAIKGELELNLEAIILDDNFRLKTFKKSWQIIISQSLLQKINHIVETDGIPSDIDYAKYLAQSVFTTHNKNKGLKSK